MYDLIHKGMLIDNQEQIGYSLLQLINNSLTREVFPQSLEESMITPIKKINKTKKVEDLEEEVSIR